MRDNIFKSVVFMIVGVSLLSVGCESVDSGYEGLVGMTDPDKVRLQTDLKWMSPQPRIRPVSADDMVIYCRVRNSAGADVDVSEAVKDKVEDMGYTLTRNIDEARFTLNADVRYLGEGAKKDLGPVVIGGVLGGVTGAVIDHNVGKDNITTGAIGGAAAGALLGNIVANRNKIREFSLVVDVVIGERVKGQKVATTRRSSETTKVTHSDTFNKGGGTEGGRSSAGSSENQSVSIEEDFLYHTNRITATAKKMNLTLSESAPVLTDKISRAIAGSLP